MTLIHRLRSTPFNAAFNGEQRSRSAFTLLEVILALAVLAGSIAMLSEMISLASRSASSAYSETRAQLLATSLMDEMVVGLTPLEEKSDEPLEVEDTVDWIYSVAFDDTEIDSLMSVEVIVEQDLERKYRPVKYRLVRWVPSASSSEEDAESEDSSEESDSEGGEDG